MAVFRQKVHLKKVYYKVSLYEYSQRQSCKAFTGLSIRAKTKETSAKFLYHIKGTFIVFRQENWSIGMGGERSLLPENLSETDQPPSKTAISNQYSLVAPLP